MRPTAEMFVDVDIVDESPKKEEKHPQKQPRKTKEKAPVIAEEVVLPSSDHNTTTLPSEGVLGYPEEVEYRDILVKDEEILASATVESYAKTLNAVLKSVLNDCEFYEQMSIHDRDFMLIWVWATNYTATKQVEITCGSCGTKHTHVVDMTALPQKPIKKDIKVPFEIPLRNGNKIFVRLNTVADELFAEEYVRKNKKFKFEHVMMVRSIDVGVDIPFESKMRWVSENLSGKEMGLVRQFHRHFAFGLDSYIEHVCPACNEVTRGAIPFQTEDILFPTVQSDFEKLL